MANELSGKIEFCTSEPLMNCVRTFFILGILTAANLGSATAAAADADFNRDIRPILSNTCFKCHGPDPEHRQGDLRLDMFEDATADRSGSQAIKPGDPDSSEAVRRMISSDPDVVMPPPDSGRTLKPEQIELLRRWIRQGARYQAHWAFTPIVRPAVPEVRQSDWVRNPIDRFILARLEAAGVQPSPPAEPHTLVRRAYLDLLGLPPSLEEVDAFLADPAADAYERLVDRLLADPHYGERWGRYWLDLARYADTNGYRSTRERSIWPYRDWVINALNRDMPFDQFTIEQLAGDLLPDGDARTTDRHRLSPQHAGQPRRRDRPGTIPQRGGRRPRQHDRHRVARSDDRLRSVPQSQVRPDQPARLLPAVRVLQQRSGREQRHADVVSAEHEQTQQLVELDRQIAAAKAEPALPEAELKAKQEARKKLAASIPSTMVMADLPQPRETHVLVRGDFLRKGDPVQPDVPASLPGLPETPERRTRLDLARWLVDPRNPLTARVVVNRVWMRYFGHGLVETENDFGMQGSLPTHPELLDWLAAEFREQGWSLKRLQRLIVTSATYRQSSHARPDLENVDPLNGLLARQTRLRVDAELVRDLTLSVSGLLNPKIGGPSVYPPQPDGVYAFTQRQAAWPTSTGPDRYRRSLYTFFMRSAPYPMLTTFDAPNFNQTCTRRARSNTPLQSLTMANDQALFVNTGSPQPGRPSMGAWVTYGLGSESDDLPGFVVLQSGRADRGPGPRCGPAGFCPRLSKACRSAAGRSPILNLTSPAGLTRQREREFADAVGDLNRRRRDVVGDPEIATRIAAYEMAYRMQTSAPELMDIRDESQEMLDAYGAAPASRRSRTTVCWRDGWSSAASGSSSCTTPIGIITAGRRKTWRRTCRRFAATWIRPRPRWFGT